MEKVDKKRMKPISEAEESGKKDSEAPIENKNGANLSAPANNAESGVPPEPAEASGGEMVNQKKLEEAEARAAENYDKYVRTLAEFDNFRKRTMKEKSSMYGSGVMDVVKALLPVIDSFERALASCGEEEKSAPVYTGMTLIYKQLRQFMDVMGISEIEAVGCEFDPDVHSAVAHADDPDHGENEIIEELQKGYMLKDKVLRYSMVRVAN